MLGKNSLTACENMVSLSRLNQETASVMRTISERAEVILVELDHINTSEPRVDYHPKVDFDTSMSLREAIDRRAGMLGRISCTHCEGPMMDPLTGVSHCGSRIPAEAWQHIVYRD